MSEPDVNFDAVFGPPIMVDEVLAIDEISNLLTNSIFDLERLLNDIIIVAAYKTGRMAGALWLIDTAVFSSGILHTVCLSGDVN